MKIGCDSDPTHRPTAGSYSYSSIRVWRNKMINYSSQHVSGRTTYFLYIYLEEYIMGKQPNAVERALHAEAPRRRECWNLQLIEIIGVWINRNPVSSKEWEWFVGEVHRPYGGLCFYGCISPFAKQRQAWSVIWGLFPRVEQSTGVQPLMNDANIKFI